MAVRGSALKRKTNEVTAPAAVPDRQTDRSCCGRPSISPPQPTTTTHLRASSTEVIELCLFKCVTKSTPCDEPKGSLPSPFGDGQVAKLVFEVFFPSPLRGESVSAAPMGVR